MPADGEWHCLSLPDVFDSAPGKAGTLRWAARRGLMGWRVLRARLFRCHGISFISAVEYAQAMVALSLMWFVVTVCFVLVVVEGVRTGSAGMERVPTGRRRLGRPNVLESVGARVHGKEVLRERLQVTKLTMPEI